MRPLKKVGAGAFFGTKTCLTGKTPTPCRIVRYRYFFFYLK